MKGIRGRITALGAASVLAVIALPPDTGAWADGSCTGATCPVTERAHTLPALVDARPDVPRTPGAAAAAARAALRDRPDACGGPYVKGHGELGPAHLPRAGYFGSLVRGYVRYGGLSPAEFTYRYWDGAANPAYWRYPPDLGFTHSGGWSNGRILRERETLPEGSLLDRFGSPYGAFLAPAGSAFSARALPPDSLNTKSEDPAHLCNYHLYRVNRAFDVDAGPIAPAFQQRGGGRQYVLMSAYLPGAPSSVNVMWLVANGYLSVIY
ncbi:TNT domain-containing protein [Actinoallomurus sp. CA-142502]|uniref:TNT domain-containing protein n=1 Tax=Actinoallomurus sp. CA-142502 TaxID=3239885 RepID=UPI003D93E2BB